jgi:lysophospholipase L1-like esterase
LPISATWNRVGPAHAWAGAFVLLLALLIAGCGASPVSPTPNTQTPPVTHDPDPEPDPTPPVPPAPVLRYTRLVAFGDSMTEGVTSLAPLPWLLVATQPYPAMLQGRLLARYTTQAVSVANEGRAGEWAANGVTRLPGVLRSRRPEVVILMEGVNDLNNGATVSATANAMEDMVRMCVYQGTAVMLAGLPPQRPGGSKASSAALVGPYNDRLRAVAAAKGAEFVDIAAAFGGDLSLISADGLHPNDAGYDRIAQALYDRVVALYEKPPASMSVRLR